jgi:D-alanyl-D-alanine-carboxypeptidase/D-alanyl-D-alanine-endopeptidase
MYRNVIVATLASLFIASSATAADFTNVDKLVQPLLDSDTIVGCVVGIIDGDKKEIRGYGTIHHGKDDKPNGDTIYEIGSVTKAFTGTLLADMANRGEVKVDAPLQDFMPEGVKLRIAKDKPIRLVDLASQTSGLPRLPSNMQPKDAGNPYADYSAKQMFDFLSKYELTRPPGTYEYSNLGMGLLGNTLAQKSGKPYETLVVERICDPLEMNDTRITLSDDQRKRLAPGYNGALESAMNWDFDALAGCGAMRSTANDLLKLAEASLSNDKRPVVAAIHEAWKPHYGKPGQIGVGLGWHIARDGATRWHNGQTFGYSAAVFVYQPKKVGVVVLCNTATDSTTELAEKLIQSTLGMSPPPIAVRKSIKLAPDVLKQYEGTYALSLLFAITVTAEDGKLMAQATGQEKAQIFPESATKFFYKVVDAQIDFEKGKDGKVEKLILHQNGQDIPGMKLPAPKKQI